VPAGFAPFCPLWFRIFDHEDAGFDPDKAYLAVGIVDYSESSVAQVFFVSDKGYLWGIPQDYCVCVNLGLSRALEDREREFVLPSDGDEPQSDWERPRR
jgi:hypothetical protein